MITIMVDSLQAVGFQIWTEKCLLKPLPLSFTFENLSADILINDHGIMQQNTVFVFPF